MDNSWPCVAHRIDPRIRTAFSFSRCLCEGVYPFSILLASSIVQDGHGMLPMLAHSRRMFISVKLITFIVGTVMGAILLLLGV